ncbi:MAG TPA: hypothetical protein VE685_03920 [Thermoanaerobaculia bacterium]|nr:hypothetical protein [Thermoanaerobaculia bacterium]
MKRNVLVTLVLLMLTGTSAVSALIPCESCSENEPSARCIGTCNGQSVNFCRDWIAMGCPTWNFVSKETFLLSLEAQALEEPLPSAPEAQPSF